MMMLKASESLLVEPSLFEPLLKETMGLDAVSIGSAAIQRAVRERLAACKLKDVRAYWERIHASETELQELIEAVVVPETWFFRDRGAFGALARLAQEVWPRTRPNGCIRLLSLPCSTGEEPYSMVMGLADAAFPMHRLHVDAVDISRRSLAYAHRAVYTRNSFRGNDLGFRNRYFEATPHGYRLADGVRKPVHFLQGNLVESGFLPGAGIYDVIFCRNLLIYFDRMTQDRVIGVLTRLLSTDGLLFVGPSETGLLLEHNFVSVKMPLAFAFRKADAVPPEPKHSAPPKRTSSRIQATPPVSAHRPKHDAQHKHGIAAKSAPPAAAMPMESMPKAQKDALDEAERLANQGDLVRAMEHCESHIQEHGPSARAFYLMGLVHDAAGREEDAHSQYRRVLYLDPSHHEALIHLAFLLEKRGDTAGAQVLHARAKRARGGSLK